jgi:hypothetical protein
MVKAVGLALLLAGVASAGEPAAERGVHELVPPPPAAVETQEDWVAREPARDSTTGLAPTLSARPGLAMVGVRGRF